MPMEGSHVDRAQDSAGKNCTRSGRRKPGIRVTLRRPLIAYLEKQAEIRGESVSSFVEYLVERHQEKL